MLCIKVFMTMFAIAAAYSDIEDNYHTALLGNHETLKKFYMCLVDKSPCDPFGKEVKGHLVEALKDNCRECDPTQKHYAHIVMTLLKSDYPDMYEVFEAKYDPKRNLFANFTTKTKDF